MSKKKKSFCQTELLAIKKNETYTVTIEGMTAEGNGVAKINQFAVFVPDTAIGDCAKIKIVKVLSKYGFGIVEELLEPSSSRIENNCPVYHQCGGCCYRHLSYEAELALKQQQVEDCFQRLGGVTLSADSIVGGELQDGYRNKAQFPVGVDKDGKIIAGFYAKRSHRIVPCTNCLLQPTIFATILDEVLFFFNEHHITPYHEETASGNVRHIYLRQAEHGKEIMLCFICAQKTLPKQEALISRITARFPQIKSIVLNYNPRRDNVILGTECTTLFGQDYITDTMCNVQVEISPLSFYQVNKPQAERLYQEALRYANPSKDSVLLDLYCGIGTIGLSTAHAVKTMIGVEIIPQAIENAKKNAVLNEFSNTRFLCGDCKSVVPQLEKEQLSPDIIIVDPPRKGCDKDVLDTIVRLSPEKVVMVSCNPATAARDVKLLEEQGYRIKRYRPFDLFPRTAHVESVTLLQKL